MPGLITVVYDGGSYEMGAPTLYEVRTAAIDWITNNFAESVYVGFDHIVDNTYVWFVYEGKDTQVLAKGVLK